MRIGIDLGGTKIAAVVVDGDADVRAPLRVPTPSDYGQTVRAIAELVEALESEAGRSASVGVGTPGAICPDTGVMIHAENTALGGRSLVADLSARLRRPVRVANDANCFALSEAVDGAGAGAEVVVGLIFGTGVGAGLVVHGRPLHGANAIAGEWGHNPLPWPADGELGQAPCYCGRSGCIEMFLAGPGIARDHHHVTGARLGAADIVAAASEGRADAVATLERFHDRLARSVATVINLLDPNVIVLGGGVSKIDEIYGELPKRLSALVFARRLRTQIVPNVHGDASGVRGAAWLWAAEEWRRGLPRGRKN